MSEKKKFYVRYCHGPFKADVEDCEVEANDRLDAKEQVKAKEGEFVYILDIEEIK